MDKPTLCVDFGGVLNYYAGWTHDRDLGQYRLGARDFIANAATRYKVVIFTTRNPDLVWQWLEEHDMRECVSEVTNVKPPAKCYVDDRAVRFDGNFVETLEEVDNFKTYWEKTLKK